MKIFFTIFFILYSDTLLSKELNRFHFSPTFAIDLPLKITSKLELPSLNSKILSVDNSEIFVLHQKPDMFANLASSERYWKSSRLQTKSSELKEKNLGCSRITSRTFKCSRDVIQNHKFLSESIFWNAKNDLVLVRATSKKSLLDSRKLLEKLIIVQNSRLPAGNIK